MSPIYGQKKTRLYAVCNIDVYYKCARIAAAIDDALVRAKELISNWRARAQQRLSRRSRWSNRLWITDRADLCGFIL